MSNLPEIKIRGLQKLTLLDYPGKVACTVFVEGCNWRCPFCHNASLLQVNAWNESIAPAELEAFLRKRRGILDGVCISGGEPLLCPELPALIRTIRELGYLIKIDTNGSQPQKLQELLQHKLIDYVAMDIKNTPAKYFMTSGCSSDDLQAVHESIRLLMDGEVDYEFRTTVVRELHEPKDLQEIGQWLIGARRYFLQSYVDSGDILEPYWHSYAPEEMQRLAMIVRQYIPETQVRGT